MIYNIPISNEEVFLKKVKRIMNKCHNGEVVVLPLDIVLVKDADRKLQYKCRQYEVKGEYKIEGWEFIAEIEHKDCGNVVRCVKSEYSDEIAQRYGEKVSVCEHCGKKLFRRNTFIVRNIESNELKQVGSSCVREYTNGLSAEVCAEIASFFEEIEDELMYDEKKTSHYAYIVYDRVQSLKVMYYIVRNNGYDRDESKQVFFDTYRELSADAIDELVSDDELSQVESWLETKSNSNAYWCSCKTLYKTNELEFRDYNYLLSMFATYFKEQVETARNNEKKNEYVGQVGDRITFTIYSMRFLYTKGCYTYGYNRAIQTDVYELLDKEGHTYIWSTTSYPEVGSKIKATIKGHQEYNGIKQTIITRASIEEEK